MKKRGRIKKVALLMFKKRQALSLVILLDVLSVLVFLSLRFVEVSVDNILFPSFVNVGRTNLVYSISYVIIEFVMMILVYSFFKYLVIKFIHEPFEKVKFGIKEFITFLNLNLIVFLPVVVMLALGLDLMMMFFNNWLSKGGVDPFMFVFVILGIGIVAIILFILVYTFINILHFSFFKERSLGRLLRKGMVNSSKIGNYGMYWSNFKIILVMGFFLMIIHLFVKSFIFDDFSTYVRNVGNYRIFIYGVVALVFYFLLSFNRLNFYMDTVQVYKKGNP